LKQSKSIFSQVSPSK